MNKLTRAILLLFHWLGRKLSKRYYKQTMVSCANFSDFTRGVRTIGGSGKASKVFLSNSDGYILYMVDLTEPY